ncbi:autotransporter assembly complex protein TamA [Noviherbaspirillum galbum]|uniref:Translocation and assembly module subunit TamA n=1 Tax=Noviherbaspirillum galbum TaxID=2709383 RepID=A0A6B3SFQ1_9BURK|nr:autotransporter assembly complex family protein [Noviherbaspirillum galbum]NEX59684.1 outer membrane protein assembly factor [Noviherbaspirillum galbum]
MAPPVRRQHLATPDTPPAPDSRRSSQARHALAAFLLTLLFLQAGPALGAAYQVELEGLDGFRALSSLLNQHVALLRRQEDAIISDEELTRLMNAAPDDVRELLATQGYFSPAITSSLDLSGGERVARLKVDPGPPTTITRVDLRFKGEIVDGPRADPRRVERLKRRWSLDPGDRFTQQAWVNAKNELLKGLLAADFAAAGIVHSEALIQRENHGAVLSIDVDSGPAFTFGTLEVHGLQRYSRDLIDLLNPISPGDAYSLEKLNEFQSRLEDTGYFRTAFTTVEADVNHPKNSPVRVDLVENTSKRLSFGVGYSTDTGARLQAKWLDRNFLMRNWRLESELRIDRDTRLLGSELFFPAIQNGWQPSVGAHLERTVAAGETDDKLRLVSRLSSANKADEKVWSVGYYGDQQRIGDFEATRQAVLLSFNYTQRRLDHPLTPRRGYLLAAEIGAGPKGLVNETNILRTVVRGTTLIPFAPRWQAIFRGFAGQVFGGSRLTVPGDLLFRAGGDQSVRGYGYNTLGPAQNDAIVGGPVSAVLSAEVVYFFKPPWGVAAFTDAGNAADSWREFRFAHGTGVGARWRSPIGPVNVDLAYNHETHRPRLHFSVGYGF